MVNGFYGFYFKGHGEKLFKRVLSKNIIWTMHINIFQLFNNIWLMIFMFVFLRDMERNFLKGFSPRTFCEPCILIFFNFSNLFVPYIYSLFFEGHGEKLFFNFSKIYYWLHINIFQLFNNIWLIVFILRDMERNFFERFSPRTFCEPCILIFFNFSILFVPYILCLFFEGHGEKSF